MFDRLRRLIMWEIIGLVAWITGLLLCGYSVYYWVLPALELPEPRQVEIVASCIALIVTIVCYVMTVAKLSLLLAKSRDSNSLGRGRWKRSYLFAKNIMPENALTNLAFWIPRKHREGIVGDILEDCAELRELGKPIIRIWTHVLWHLATAIILLVPSRIGDIIGIRSEAAGKNKEE